MKFCPECGAYQLAATSPEAPQGEPVGQRSRQQFYTFASVAVFALAFTAYGISRHVERDSTAVVQAAQGPIDTPTVVAIPAASAAAGNLEPSAAPQVLASPRMPAPMANMNVAQQNVDPAANRHEEHVAARTITASTHADVARNLASARASLDKNSLWPARKAIMSALAEDPTNGAALQMQAELISREQERDALLGNARLCARDGQWVCAWQNAGHALTVDASSRQASALLTRAIAERGASTEGRPDAGPPYDDDNQ